MNNQAFANRIRIETCKMIEHVGFGHLGAALSIVEVLAVLFNDVMDLDGEKPNRDWFVLSKGHGGPSYYATLALKGHFDVSVLKTLNQNGTILPSHPDRLTIPGVDATTGSLGQGISQAVGIAKGLKIQNIEHRVYCIVGDGEMNEGQVYEALLFAQAQGLDNFTVFVDNNKKQLDGRVHDISIQYQFQAFFESMGFETKSVDGRDVDAIKAGIESMNQPGMPKAIILDTDKCQGLPYFVALEDNHHLRFTPEQLEILHSEIKRLVTEDALWK